MTWQTRYPEIAKGMEQAEQRLKTQFCSGKEYKARTPEEAVEEHAKAMARLKESHPEIYNGLPCSKTEVIDWGALITPRKSFEG